MLTYADVCRYERGNQKMESLNGERTLLQVFFCVWRGSMLSIKGLLRLY